MKKLLTVIALVAFMGTAMSATFTEKLNNGLNTLNQKEQALNKKIDDAQAKRTEQKEAVAKKQAEQKAAVEKKKADAKAKVDAKKKAVDDTKNNAKNTADNAKKAVTNEVNYWKNLTK